MWIHIWFYNEVHLVDRVTICRQIWRAKVKPEIRGLPADFSFFVHQSIALGAKSSLLLYFIWPIRTFLPLTLCALLRGTKYGSIPSLREPVVQPLTRTARTRGDLPALTVEIIPGRGMGLWILTMILR